MYYNLISSMSRGGVAYDADAQAFLTATGITDLTISNAINTLVVGLKSNVIWDKMVAIYPFVGGTATTHKYNLKNPADTDGAHRLEFYGGLTHSSTGIKPNGTNGYADTNVNALNDLIYEDSHFSYYSRENIKNDAFLGLASTSDAKGLQLYLRGDFYNEKIHGAIGNSVGDSSLDNIIADNTDSRGLFLITRVSTTTSELYKNGTSLATKTSGTTGSFQNRNVFLMCRNLLGTAGAFDTREIAFSTLGFSLTDTDSSNLYTLVQAFQTALIRNV